jgi:hypothetical protein
MWPKSKEEQEQDTVVSLQNPDALLEEIRKRRGDGVDSGSWWVL